MTELALLDLPRLFAGLLMLTLAFWALAVDIRSKVMRLFALFMVLRGLLNVLLPFTQENPASTASVDLWTAYSGYFQIAMPFAAVAFALRLIQPEASLRRWQWSLMAATVVFEMMYLFDHSLFWGVRGHRGPLFQLLGLGPLAYMAVAHILIRHASRARPLHLAGLSYALFPVFAAAVELGQLARRWDSGHVDTISVAGWGMYMTRIAVLVYAAFILAEIARSGSRRRAIAATVTLLSTFLCGLIPYYLVMSGSTTDYYQLAAPLNGLFTALMPAAIGWAITRDAFFGRTGTVRLGMAQVAILFALVWLLIMAALYVSISGVPGAAVLIGTVAIALLLFLLMQSRNMGVPAQRA